MTKYETEIFYIDSESHHDLESAIKKVIELEHRLHQLEPELAQIRAEGSAAVEEVHRSYRRDLVPMDQSVVIYRREKR